MGQSSSTPSKSARRLESTVQMPHHQTATATATTCHVEARRDHTLDIPDEILALIFQSLSSGYRRHCSLVCRRWLLVDAQSRHRLSLDARSALIEALPSLLSRFHSLSKLALRCDRRSESISDAALDLVAVSCPNLTRLKLRCCKEITSIGMKSLATKSKKLKKLSVGSCSFGAKGIDAVVQGCPNLEEISIKRLRGLNDGESVGCVAKSLRSVCLKELYNGNCFGPLLAGAENLKTLKVFRCSGDWDRILEEVAERVKGIAEVHLEKLGVTDRGMLALSLCSELEVLHLVKTPECTDLGLSSVADKCRLLRKLHVDGWKTNRIGDEGLVGVAKRCVNLQELVLIGVNPTTVSLGLIASNCKNLERLALCSSDTFGDDEIKCLASKCVALKKLCIKGCPVTDRGMEALVEGCPKLIKVKVKKCKGVTPEGADWLRARRELLTVNLDSVAQIENQDASMSESGMNENDVDVVENQIAGLVDQPAAIDLPSSSSRRLSPWKYRMGFGSRRNFFASTFRRWGHGGGSRGRGSSTDHRGTE